MGWVKGLGLEAGPSALEEAGRVALPVEEAC